MWLELAVDELDTEGLMNLVYYRSSQSATNFLYFQPMCRWMNWNRQIDCYFDRNCNRSTVVMDELDLLALMVAAAVAAGRTKYPKKDLMNPKRIVALPERTVLGTGPVSVAAAMMMMKRMIRDQMKKQKSKNSVTQKEKTTKII